MPKAKVRHGLIFYTDDDGNQQTAWRGQTVELPQKEFDRLDSHGALLKPDDELPMSGRLMPLPNLASDEELIAWASVATKAEIREAIADRPALADRLQAAFDTVQEKLKAQDELLSGLKPTIAEGKRKSKSRAKPVKATPAQQAKATAAKKTAASAGAADDEEEEEELDEDDPRAVVQEDAAHVSEFLSEHPEAADDILAAEEEAATNNDREVRPAVVEAVRLAKSNMQ